MWDLVSGLGSFVQLNSLFCLICGDQVVGKVKGRSEAISLVGSVVSPCDCYLSSGFSRDCQLSFPQSDCLLVFFGASALLGHLGIWMSVCVLRVPFVAASTFQFWKLS